MITYMRAWMSLIFGQIQPLVSMVTDRVMVGKMVSPLFLGCFSSDPFHTCRQWWHAWELSEFEFRLDWTTDCGVSCPWKSEKILIGLQWEKWSWLFSLSPKGCIKILTYLIWGFLGAAIFDCIIRSCDLFNWFIRTCLGPTVVPAAITSLELFCVLTMCYFSDNVSSKENIKILWLIFMFYYSDIIAIKNSYWFFSFT